MRGDPWHREGKGVGVLTFVMSEAEAVRKGLAKRRHKYNAKPVMDVDGKHDSTSEHGWYRGLELQQRAGIISDLQRQVRIRLMVNGSKVCDMILDAVFKRDGRLVFADHKGYITEAWKLKAKLFTAITGEQIEIHTKQGINGSGRGNYRRKRRCSRSQRSKKS